MAERRDARREIVEVMTDGCWWSERQLRAVTGLGSTVNVHLQQLRTREAVEDNRNGGGPVQYRLKHQYRFREGADRREAILNG